MSERLAGKVGVITGAGSGIGLATARRFAAEGAKVVCADLDSEAGARAAAEVGGRYVQVDVASEAQVRDLYQGVVDESASWTSARRSGISPPEDDSILTTGLEVWQRVQEVNLTSVYLCSKYAIGHMLEHVEPHQYRLICGGPRVGHVASLLHRQQRRRAGLDREFGVQFARQGIRVNALCPGPVNTPLLKDLFAKDADRAARRLVHVPMGRFAEPEEIAAAVTFLASDDASFITASTFLVDGGIGRGLCDPRLVPLGAGLSALFSRVAPGSITALVVCSYSGRVARPLDPGASVHLLEGWEQMGGPPFGAGDHGTLPGDRRFVTTLADGMRFGPPANSWADLHRRYQESPPPPRKRR